MKSFTTALLFALSVNAQPAHAEWIFINSDKDVFGNVNVTVSGDGGNGGNIRFECGTGKKPLFAYLVKDSDKSDTKYEATLLHMDQNGTVHRAQGKLGRWNDNYWAVEVYDQEALERMAGHMVVATTPLSVGIELNNGSGYRKADTFSSKGSTAAGRLLYEHCLDLGN